MVCSLWFIMQCCKNKEIFLSSREQDPDYQHNQESINKYQCQYREQPAKKSLRGFPGLYPFFQPLVKQVDRYQR